MEVATGEPYVGPGYARYGRPTETDRRILQDVLFGEDARMRIPGHFALFAATGAGAGLVLTAREVAQQSYLAQGLWRTSLRVAGHGAVTGLVIGAVAGLVLLLLLFSWCRAIALAGQRRKSRMAAGRIL